MENISTYVIVNGLPGKMASEITEYIVSDQCLGKHIDVSFSLLDVSLTGPDVEKYSVKFEEKNIFLARPNQRTDAFETIRAHKPLIAIDFTHPSAVKDNADFYCSNNIPFVMGTTGGDRSALEERVRNSDVSAVIAPNMAKPIVLLQAMMNYAAENFPNAFEGFSLEITESHQVGKADTSGTAKAMVQYFNKLGVSKKELGTQFEESDICMIRDPQKQLEFGVPECALDGHGWHTYGLESQNGSTSIGIIHNINGRLPYVEGTIDAVAFLARKMHGGSKGQVYSMIDVLRGV